MIAIGDLVKVYITWSWSLLGADELYGRVQTISMEDGGYIYNVDVNGDMHIIHAYDVLLAFSLTQIDIMAKI